MSQSCTPKPPTPTARFVASATAELERLITGQALDRDGGLTPTPTPRTTRSATLVAPAKRSGAGAPPASPGELHLRQELAAQRDLASDARAQLAALDAEARHLRSELAVSERLRAAAQCLSTGARGAAPAKDEIGRAARELARLTALRGEAGRELAALREAGERARVDREAARTALADRDAAVARAHADANAAIEAAQLREGGLRARVAELEAEVEAVADRTARRAAEESALALERERARAASEVGRLSREWEVAAAEAADALEAERARSRTALSAAARDRAAAEARLRDAHAEEIRKLEEAATRDAVAAQRREAEVRRTARDEFEEAARAERAAWTAKTDEAAREAREEREAAAAEAADAARRLERADEGAAEARRHLADARRATASALAERDAALADVAAAKQACVDEEERSAREAAAQGARASEAMRALEASLRSQAEEICGELERAHAADMADLRGRLEAAEGRAAGVEAEAKEARETASRLAETAERAARNEIEALKRRLAETETGFAERARRYESEVEALRERLARRATEDKQRAAAEIDAATRAADDVTARLRGDVAHWRQAAGRAGEEAEEARAALAAGEVALRRGQDRETRLEAELGRAMAELAGSVKQVDAHRGLLAERTALMDRCDRLEQALAAAAPGWNGEELPPVMRRANAGHDQPAEFGYLATYARARRMQGAQGARTPADALAGLRSASANAKRAMATRMTEEETPGARSATGFAVPPPVFGDRPISSLTTPASTSRAW